MVAHLDNGFAEWLTGRSVRIKGKRPSDKTLHGKLGRVASVINLARVDSDRVEDDSALGIDLEALALARNEREAVVHDVWNMLRRHGVGVPRFATFFALVESERDCDA